MKKLIVYLKDYKKESILGPLFKLIESLFELMVPIVVANIIDIGIANSDSGYIMRMCAVLVSLGVIGLICALVAQYYAAKAAVGFTAKMKHALFSHIQSLSYHELDMLGTSSMITRMTGDANQVQSGVNLILRLFLRSPFIVFGSLVLAYTINTSAGNVFAVTIPILSVVIFGIMLVSIPLYRKVQSGLDRVLGITRENLSGARVIRAFGREDDERELFDKENSELTHRQLFVGRISALMNPVTYVIINFAVIALIWTGAVKVDSGIISRGEVVALLNYMSQILIELIKLANLIITVTKAFASAKRIESVLEIRPGMEFPADDNTFSCADAPAVEFDNVGIRYHSTAGEALRGVSFRAFKGQTVGIIGGTGSGKTTLVNLICRFYDATSGSIKINGTDIRRYSAQTLRKMIGVVPQKAVLFQGTLRDNLRWRKKDADDSELYAALETAQAKDIVDSKSNGLDEMISEGGKNFSGGQRQRLTIARALVGSPDILILDDSASALDYATDAALRASIKNLGYSPTVFIVSQRAFSVKHADFIIALDDGEVVGIGTHDRLIATCEVYREIYSSQFPDDAEGGVKL